MHEAPRTTPVCSASILVCATVSSRSSAASKATDSSVGTTADKHVDLAAAAAAAASSSAAVWHSVHARWVRDPDSGRDLVLLTQTDITAKVWRSCACTSLVRAVYVFYPYTCF